MVIRSDADDQTMCGSAEVLVTIVVSGASDTFEVLKNPTRRSDEQFCAAHSAS